jgi:ABC-type antimicrobial peptide transport system permease subunit
MAVALAVIGIYGLMSYNVAERTKEFGIRLALGTPRASMLRDVLGNAILLAVSGAVLGGLLSIWLNRVLANLLYGVRPHDLLSIAIVSALLLVTAIGAALQPAWKAIRTDPIAALRAE